MKALMVGDTEIAFPYAPILICFRGSQAHGTYIPPTDPSSVDDIDLFACCLPPLDYALGLKQWEGKDFWVNEFDIVCYNLDKFVRLLLKGNPNVHQSLWVRPEDFVYMNDIGRKLYDHREEFIGKKPIYDAFCGYARSQLKRMTHTQPYAGYMGAKRKALVEEHGFDTKNAAHMIRLLSMCKEFLETGTFQVYRIHDADQLIDIKCGKWQLADIQLLAAGLFADCERLYARCDVPELPDFERANRIVIECLLDFHRLQLYDELRNSWT